MTKAGIAIDAWKEPVFTEGLTLAGFSYELVGILTPLTKLITVGCEPEQMTRLEQVVRECNNQCKRMSI